MTVAAFVLAHLMTIRFEDVEKDGKFRWQKAPCAMHVVFSSLQCCPAERLPPLKDLDI